MSKIMTLARFFQFLKYSAGSSDCREEPGNLMGNAILSPADQSCIRDQLRNIHDAKIRTATSGGGMELLMTMKPGNR